MISDQQHVNHFISGFTRWASKRPDILGVALVGSFARNEATEASDIDLVIIAGDPQTYLKNTQWAERFGPNARKRLEIYGKVTSLRVWYTGGPEVEYGFADETGPVVPLDEGTKKVISGGMRILTERRATLSRAKRGDSSTPP